MDADRQVLRSLQLPASDVNGYGPSANIGAIAFDTFEELFWVGDCHGRITSYISVQLERYTSLKAHEEAAGPVLQFAFTDKGVISLSSRSLHFMTRRGLTQWYLVHPSITQLHCMLLTDKNSSLLVAGSQDVMLKIDVSQGTVTDTIKVTSEYTILRQGRWICAATVGGSVDFLDPKTYQVMKTWQAHSASINSMEISGNYLVTCGRAIRPHGPAMLENLAKVYDLKGMQQLAPIPFPGGAAFVQIHPRLSNTSVLGSTNGQLQIIDLVNPNTSNLVILGSFITHFVLSPSGSIWAVADQDNILQLYGSPTKAMSFNDTVELPVFADEPEQVQRIALDEDSPFAIIGMPFYRERLMSAWGNEKPWDAGGLPPKIDADIARTLRPAIVGQFAPNPRNKLRNQSHQERLSDATGASFPSPKFLSQQAKELENGLEQGRRISDAAEALAGLSFSNATRADVPWYYMNVKIKYGKYGVADFDFRAYNNTNFSGLETDISNHYLNPLLQLFKYTPMVRNQSLQHVAGSCLEEDCLLCELGFLVDMLEKASGEVCQATNFLKIVSSSSHDAASLNIFDDQAPLAMSLTERLSVAARYLFNRFSIESRKVDVPESSFERILNLSAQMVMKCMNCQSETYRRASSLSLDLLYPDIAAAARARTAYPRFCDILKYTFNASSQSKGYCKSCRRYPQLSHRRSVMDLPTTLMLDAALDRTSKMTAQLWAVPGWLPREIALGIHPGGDVMCFEGAEVQRMRGQPHLIEYELVGFVADINSLQGQKSHPVSFINVAITDPVSTGDDEDNWHLFNDFLVRKIDTTEALQFSAAWKLPIILTYQTKALRHHIDDSWKEQPDISCLYNLGSLNYAREPGLGFPLQQGLEIPQPGFHLAIDAEFVSLEQEEIEVRIDGAVEVVKPVRQGTGRISALRGSGSEEGIPFIDDYIKINEPIVDHLTQYSGLSAGDLDPHRSTHALQSLKVAYKKLWLLLNLGCTFVGHGLVSDFRTINIHIPKSQIIDTVTLFRPANEKRRLSLRFLAWYFLDEEIQTGNHDSIVDARTALQLWRKYQEFVAAGVLEQKLAQIYRDGPNTAFKPPAEFEASGGKIGRVAGGNKSSHSKTLASETSPAEGNTTKPTTAPASSAGTASTGPRAVQGAPAPTGPTTGAGTGSFSRRGGHKSQQSQPQHPRQRLVLTGRGGARGGGMHSPSSRGPAAASTTPGGNAGGGVSGGGGSGHVTPTAPASRGGTPTGRGAWGVPRGR